MTGLEERRLCIDCGLDQTFESEYDSEKFVYKNTAKPNPVKSSAPRQKKDARPSKNPNFSKGVCIYYNLHPIIHSGLKN